MTAVFAGLFMSTLFALVWTNRPDMSGYEPRHLPSPEQTETALEATERLERRRSLAPWRPPVPPMPTRPDPGAPMKRNDPLPRPTRRSVT